MDREFFIDIYEERLKVYIFIGSGVDIYLSIWEGVYNILLYREKVIRQNVIYGFKYVNLVMYCVDNIKGRLG